MATKGYKTPAQLGFNPVIQQQFAAAGITELPEWMGRVASDKRDLSDLVATYAKFSSPNFDWKSVDNGKAADILSNMGWTIGPDGTPIKSAGGIPTTYMRPAGQGGDSAPDDPSMNPANFVSAYPGYQQGETWSDADKDFFLETLIRRKTKPNVGAWEESIKPAVMGIGSIASMVAAPYLAGAGAMAPAVEGAAGAGAGIEAGGGWLGALEGGMGAYGTGGAGAAGSLGTIGSLAAGGGSAIGGSSVGGSAIADAIAAGGAAGADVGMGAGTSLLTDLGLPAAYGAGLSGLGDYASTALQTAGAGSTSSGGGSWLDSLIGGIGGSSGGSNLLGTLLGIGGAVGGGIMADNAMQDAIKESQKYYEPFYNLGVGGIPALQSTDPTGGAGRYQTELESLGKNFQFDSSDPAYTYKMDEMTKAANKNLAARGMYNSSAALNLLDQSGRGIMADEYDKQYNRKYGNLTDLYTMASKTGATDYGKALDLVKIGAGSASSAGAGSLASGQSSANLWSGLGAMPLNYMLLSSMLNK